jgi:ubiquinone/menaquinone biosynthesis C-methylase UbiE
MDGTYRWPIPPGYACEPVWTRQGFRLGKETLPILAYEVGNSNWTEDLATFNEQHASSDHFIDRASRSHALRQIKKHARGPAPVILEVGCYTGFLLQELQKELPHARLIGSDYLRGPLERLAVRMPDVPLLQFDLVKCPLPDESVDVAVLLNVLVHIPDDGAAVRQLYRILKPGGTAVIEVAAGPHLYDVFDKIQLHHRRYHLSGLRRLLEESGFHVAHASSLGAFLYPAFRYVKMRNRRYLEAPEEVQKEVVARAIQKSGRNRLCEALMWVEGVVRNWLPLPFGIRWLATCVKPEGASTRQRAAA